MGMKPFLAGAIGIFLVVFVSYGAYTKFANPFATSYTANAIFASANGLKQDALVRIAGVNVGKVQSVQPMPGCTLAAINGPDHMCTAAKVTMAINNTGLPIHKDATFWIRPRIFLEGNFFVEINPGSPSAPNAPDGFTFAIQQGREPVQFDQLLTSLQSDTRTNLQILLQQYGLAVKQGGPDFNRSIQYWLPAYKFGAQVSHDTLGLQAHDLSGWIDKAGQTNGALSKDGPALESLITNLNVTAGAFARQSAALQSAVAELPRTLGVAIPSLTSLNNALPPFRRFALALVPGVQSTGPMVDASLPFFSQLRQLVQPAELQGLVHDLSSTVPALAKLNAESIPFFKNQVRPASSCQVNEILPWTHLTLQDPHFNAANGVPPRPVYVEGVDFLPGLNGEMRTFDANGPYIRVLLTGGTLTYSLQPGLFGTALNSIGGVQPQLPAPHASGDGAKVPVSRPPLKPTVPCETQPAITDLSAPTGAGPTPVTGAALDTPAAQARAQSAGLLQLAQLMQQTKQQHLSARFVNHLPGH
jgi:ABC-type transporter Mla subunit MlaD